MLPEEALKRGDSERTEEMRMLQGCAEGVQVDLYLTHMTGTMTRRNDADSELCAKLVC